LSYFWGGVQLHDIKNMEITEEYLKTFFAKNSDYYFDKWKEFKNGKIISFKPYAFLFGLIWFLYRKMYREVLLLLLVIFLEVILEEYLLSDVLGMQEGSRKFIDCIAKFFFGLFCGMFGNYLYMKSSERKIINILSRDLSEEEKNRLLGKLGGTSWLALIILALIIVTIIYLKNYLE
ncbi:MAG: DUF2628 domain-containing protein, partial [Sporocytophaga sp.]|uniref:DUF2628 domain-containing protein n=1 Tax=Sporocytophaga sp. TaxID=2231183 RepID=UPI001B1833D9